MDGDGNRFAIRLFDGIASRYDRWAQIFSLYQYERWRHFLVSRLPRCSTGTVLDLCTGTAGVAIRIAQRTGGRVVGVDLSPGMLHQAHARLSSTAAGEKIALLSGRAESLPFPDRCFDAVCFTFLLRYVDDVPATLAEVVRVLKPGGYLASLEFGVPRRMAIRGLWYAYTRLLLPLASRWVSSGWREVGGFLGPSISRFYRTHNLDELKAVWRNVGVDDVEIKSLSLGGAVVMWGTKALSTGGK